MDALERLNHRLEAGGTEHRLYPEDLLKNPTADLQVTPIHHSLFVASDGEEIRGGTWLREQYFSVAGSRHRVGWMKYPISESLVDSQYTGVAASMVLQLLREQPRLMALGMGGHGAPFARLLAGIKWRSSTIPFRFRLVRPARVLRKLSYARRRVAIRVAMDVTAWSGLAWVAHHLHRATAYRVPPGVSVSIESQFAPWADCVWAACHAQYPVLAVRDAGTLDHLYPASLSNLQRLRVTRERDDVGWACCQILSRADVTASYFGDLRVGLVTDMLARPADAAAVLGAAVQYFEDIGTDLIITYVCHAAWLEAARRLRFVTGPSTFAFYRAPQTDKLLGSGCSGQDWHFTRSDGDGPKR